MRIRKLMYDSFYSNNEAFSGVTTVESLGSDLYFHYIKQSSGHYKLSGNTALTASGVIFEDSVTTSLVVTPNPITGATSGTQQLTVLNQDGVDVLSECTFTGATAGLITFGAVTGHTTVTVAHPDIPATPTIVPVDVFWTGALAMAPATLSGLTGTTLQTTITMVTGGYNVTSKCSFTSSTPARATVSATGLLTLLTVGTTTITATYPTGVTVSKTLTVS